jgi:hypothetical protein
MTETMFLNKSKCLFLKSSSFRYYSLPHTSFCVLKLEEKNVALDKTIFPIQFQSNRYFATTEVLLKLTSHCYRILFLHHYQS